MKRIAKVFCIAAFLSLSVNFADAQTDRQAAAGAVADKYVISARAGGVNYVEGSVTVVRKDGTSGLLLRRDEIRIGDKVSTGPDGKAEVLLNPGSYMRIGANTKFEFKTTALENLQIRMDSGSAIFEVFASAEFTVRVITPKAKLLLIQSGVFRVDAMADGGARVAVIEGQAMLADRIATLVKKGQVAVLADGASSLTKISGEHKDDLALWSKTRGKELAKQTASIKNAGVRNSLLSSYNRGGWGMNNSFGLWIFDASWGGYSFLPFGWNWSSPYGYGFHNNIGGYHLPETIYNTPVGGGTPPDRSTRTLQIGSSSVRPFEKLETSSGNPSRTLQVGSPVDSRGSSSGDYSPSVRPTSSFPVTSSSSPVVSVPSAPAPSDSAPASTRTIKP